MLTLRLLLGCMPEPQTLSTPTPPPLDPVPRPPPPLVAAADAPTVRLEPIVGLRDLVAVAEQEASFGWTVDGRPSPVQGPIVPARDLLPGEVWTVTATWDDGGSAEATATIPEPPGGNVLVLVLDDIGIDHLGAYAVNPEASPTPRMDALAAEGIRFDRAYASPVCSASRAILLTGRHARRHGVGWIIDTGDRSWALPLASVTLAEALDQAWPVPWATSAVGKWHLAGVASDRYLDHPTDQGFDDYRGSPANPSYANGYGYWVWDRNVNGVVSECTTYMTTATVDDALARIDVMAEPWFLYVAFNAAHTPLSAPPPELTTLDGATSLQDLFDATVEALDTEIGRLLDTIDPDVRARTTVMLVGDNGTPGHAIDPPIDPEHAKETVYEPGIRVPLVVNGPHVAVPGSVSQALVHVADVFPTVLHIAGVPLGGPDDGLVLDADPPVPLDGRSLLPAFADPIAPGHDLLYVESFFPNGPGDNPSIDRRALRDLRYKLLRLGDGTESFFDLQSDPLGFDDGPDLLPNLPDPEAADAHARLSAELDTIVAELHFEGF